MVTTGDGVAKLGISGLGETVSQNVEAQGIYAAKMMADQHPVIGARTRTRTVHFRSFVYSHVR